MNREVSPLRILTLVPNWLGDAAMCTPALRALRRRYPNAILTAAGRAGVCALLEDLPWIDRLEALPERPSFTEMIPLARRLRPHARDMAVVFPHSFRAALLARLTGARQRIGYVRNGRALLLTHTKMPHREQGRITPVYMAREYLELVALVDCEDDGQGLELGVSETIAKQLAPQLTGDGLLIGIAPGAAFGPSKRWMPEGFAAVADQLAREQGARIVLLTGPGEEAVRNDVLKHATVACIEPCVEGGGLAVLKAVIAQLDLLLCNDSGPRHIAIAFKRPVVCVMGPTSPRYTDSPYEIGQRVRVSLPCSPCQQPECPLEHHRCMRDISPEMVTTAAANCLLNTRMCE